MPGLVFVLHKILQLKNCTYAFNSRGTQITEDFGAYYLVFPDTHSFLTKSIKSKFADLGKQYPHAKFLQTKIMSSHQWNTSASKLFNDNLAETLAKQMNLPDNSTLFLAYGNKTHVVSLKIKTLNIIQAIFCSNYFWAKSGKSMRVIQKETVEKL